MKLPPPPSFQLDGRRALVTGAGRGIGLAAAAALAEAGAEVWLVARSADEVEGAAQAIRDAGGRAEGYVLDVTDTGAVRAFFAARPAPHILVNNAGTNRPKPLWEVTEADYAAVLDLNLRAAFFVAQAAAMRMRAEGVAGSLIHLSSQMGHVGGRNRSLYCASKFGLEGMSKAFALDLAPFGIRSNTVAPTFIETPLTRPMFADAAFRADVVSRIKLGRIGNPEDVTGAILYLASDAAGLVTGTIVSIALVMVSPNMTYPDRVADNAKAAYTKLEKEIAEGKVKPEAMAKTLKTIEDKKAEEAKNRGGKSMLGLSKPLFNLKNPGILSIPLGFFAAILATLAFPCRKAEEMWDEIYVRQNTGLGMAKAIDH